MAFADSIGNESFRCQFRAIQVAARQSDSTDMQFAGNPDRYGAQILIQDVNLGVGDGTAYGNKRARIIAAASPERDVYRGFRRAVKIVQFRSLAAKKTVADPQSVLLRCRTLGESRTGALISPIPGIREASTAQNAGL